jgi:hypothetical protein
MPPALDELRALLTSGLQRSMQGSYDRRAPAAAAAPILTDARQKLTQYTRDHPDEAEAWKLRALAEESLLSYGAAVRSLERSLALSTTRDRKDLKRLAQLKEYAAKWQKLMLSPAQLAELCEFLETTLATRPCDHTQQHARRWLLDQRIAKPDQVLKALANFGGYCDCEILLNVASV